MRNVKDRLFNVYAFGMSSGVEVIGHEVDPPVFGRVELSGWKLGFSFFSSCFCFLIFLEM